MSDKSRRKLLKSIAAGSGAIVAGKSLPESWSKPVVDSVMLPAHAETSPPAQTIFTGGSSESSVVSIQPDNMMADAIDALVPTAMAEQPVVTYMASLCITDLGDGKATVDAVIEDSYGNSSLFATGLATADGTPQYLGLNLNGCDLLASSNLMDQLGLVKDAKATSNGIYDDATIAITFGASATGFVDYQGNIMDYDINGTKCDLPEIGCANFSDIRLKTNIEALSVSRKGYNLYKFQYIDENNENTYVGVMAQDIISRNPEAVIQNESGFYMVRYDQLGLKMVTLNQWESEGPDSVELLH